MENVKVAMLRQKTKYISNMGKYGSRKTAYKQGWMDCYKWMMENKSNESLTEKL